MKSQNLDIDKNNYVIDKVTQKRVIDSNKTFVEAKELGGIRKGSRVFLSKNLKTVAAEANLNKS